jgi:hypothetical protein
MSNAHAGLKGPQRIYFERAESGKKLLKAQGIKIGNSPGTISVQLKNGFKQSRKKRLQDFALVYAMYSAVSQKAEFPQLLVACAKHQDTQSGTAGLVETSVLRCILGLDRGSPRSRKGQRVHVRKTARAIEYLMSPRGYDPEEVFDMKPGPDKSIHAFSLMRRRGTLTDKPARSDRTIRGLPMLGGKPGQRWKIIVKTELDGSLRFVEMLNKSGTLDSARPPRTAMHRLKESRRGK